MAESTQQDVDKVITAYESAKYAKEYADKIVLEMRLISDTDYKFVWTEG